MIDVIRADYLLSFLLCEHQSSYGHH